MKVRVVAAIAIVTCFALFFQNCGMQVRFASVDGKLMAKQVSENDPEALMIEGDNSEQLLESDVPLTPSSPSPSPSPSASPSPEPTAQPSATPEATATPDAPGKSGDPKPTSTPDEANNDEGEDETALEYVCVLEGPGRSVLLGFLDDAVAATKSTPDTICTTQRGCELANEKFAVKEALKRAYCKNNPNVRHATEDVLRQLIGLPAE